MTSVIDRILSNCHSTLSHIIGRRKMWINNSRIDAMTSAVASLGWLGVRAITGFQLHVPSGLNLSAKSPPFEAWK